MREITKIDPNQSPCKKCDLIDRCKEDLKNGFQIEFNGKLKTCYTIKGDT